MGRGAPDRDMRPGLRGCGDVYMVEREEEAVAVAEAAMSVSESSVCGPGASRSSWWLCDRTQGFTIVKSSSLAGLTAGLSRRELMLGDLPWAMG